MEDSKKDLMTAVEVAKHHKVASGTIYDAMNTGRLAFQYIDGRKYIAKVDALAWTPRQNKNRRTLAEKRKAEKEQQKAEQVHRDAAAALFAIAGAKKPANVPSTLPGTEHFDRVWPAMRETQKRRIAYIARYLDKIGFKTTQKIVLVAVNTKEGVEVEYEFAEPGTNRAAASKICTITKNGKRSNVTAIQKIADKKLLGVDISTL